MKNIDLGSLPAYSPWPSRILGFERFQTEARTVRKMLREYGRDKYGRLFSYVKAHPHTSVQKIVSLERGSARTACFSKGDKLFIARPKGVEALNREHFMREIRAAMLRTDTVIELGAGYGYNLSLLHSMYPHRLMGGELTSTGRKIGSVLSKGSWEMYPFNFYDRTWRVFDETDSRRILVLTRHSVEMLPQAEMFVRKLSRYRDRIVSVVQFEPLYEIYEPEDLLSMLRMRYIEMNDYNRDLWSVLSHSKHVRIERMAPAVFGLNPLFPESVIHWRFRPV